MRNSLDNVFDFGRFFFQKNPLRRIFPYYCDTFHIFNKPYSTHCVGSLRNDVINGQNEMSGCETDYIIRHLPEVCYRA